MTEENKDSPKGTLTRNIIFTGFFTIFCGFILLWINSINKNSGASHFIPVPYVTWSVIIIGVLIIILGIIRFIKRSQI